MLIVDGSMQLSASDLVGHLNCRYLTSLDLAVAKGERPKPFVWDPLLEVLAERGALHEQSYLNHLGAEGLPIVKVGGVRVDESAVTETLKAMRDGVPIIAQGALRSGQWGGRTDILRRVETPSELGSWSYEVIDTKLARETKGNSILQLCLYTDLLTDTQKVFPEFAHVVTPGSDFTPQAFRLHDYVAYYRRVRNSLLAAIKNDKRSDLYPEPKPHCEICRWRLQCNAKWREDDHLTFVAGISKSQIAELRKHGVASMAALAAVPLPLPWKPERELSKVLNGFESKRASRFKVEQLAPLCTRL